jgi:hypothetical protein
MSPDSEKDGDGAVTYFPYEVIVQGISQVAQGVRRGVVNECAETS